MNDDKRISDEIVKDLANQIALPLTEEEIPYYRKAFQDTLEVLDNVKKLDLEGVEEALNISGLQNIGFEDGIESPRTLSQQAALANVSGGSFKVKRILDK